MGFCSREERAISCNQESLMYPRSCPRWAKCYLLDMLHIGQGSGKKKKKTQFLEQDLYHRTKNSHWEH